MKRLEQVYNTIDSFLTNVISSSVSIVKILLQSDFSHKKNLPKGGKECIILGNGPSLADSLAEYASILRQYQLIAVNSFALTKEYELLKPDYYVMHDPGLWISENELSSKIYKAITEKTNWPLTLLFPVQAKKSNAIRDLESEKVKIIFYNYTIFKGFKNLKHYFFKKNLAMPQSQNVLVACLFLALNMGTQTIYILGSDHTWHENISVNDQNILCVKDVHYYDEGVEINLRPFKKGLHLDETFKVSEIFEAWTKVFKGYETINEYAETLNAKVYNASKISFIDAFERRRLS
ncbi:6-hydroxymethylpterin diphosphokinase MptE-like protein [Pseudopedobacter beijingensis]|uniref:6-hydroxymethylpterin diphosphokinase MptE-like protein n=1 Tax=Pseudopedobacter beijingensis TaxID=1207056 RepID=A0ABW4I8M1_9SPHI